MTAASGPPVAVEMVPIGFVRGGRTDLGDDHWGDVIAEIVLDDRFSADVLRAGQAPSATLF